MSLTPSRKTEDVPRLKFVLRNAAQQEIYSWTAVPARASLPPGEAVAFAPVWRRRRRMRAMSSFVLSIAATWSPQTADIAWHAFS